MNDIACLGCQNAASRGPRFIAEFSHTALFLGEHQYFEGYCVLWLKRHVRELHELSQAEAAFVMAELHRASAAVAAEFKAWKINIASLGNQVSHLHWHIFPRYENDPFKLEHPWVHAEKFKEKPDDGKILANVMRLRTALQ
jgi:diadenosine tetraphosphate (Ap4A) HIT family hydrolase